MSEHDTLAADGSSDLTLVPRLLAPQQVYAPGAIEQIIGKIEADVRARDLDISTAHGRREVKSLAYQVARTKRALDEMGLGLTDTFRKQTDAVNAERRVMRERLDALRDEVKAPLDAWEAQDLQRIADHESALRQLQACAAFVVPPATLEQIDERRREAADIWDRRWEEFEKRADRAYEETSSKLSALHLEIVAEQQARVERERVAAQEAEHRREQEALERQEREARIAEEAAESARLKAEQAAILAKAQAEAEAEALREAHAAELRRVAEAAAQERQRLDQESQAAERRAQEAREAAEAAETQRRQEAEAAVRAREEAEIAAAERTRVAREEAIAAERERRIEEDRRGIEAAYARERNIAHRRRINQDAMSGLILCGVTEQVAKGIVTAIAKGEIAHVAIQY